MHHPHSPDVSHQFDDHLQTCNASQYSDPDELRRLSCQLITSPPPPHILVRSSSITRITLDRASDTEDNDDNDDSNDEADNRPITNHQEYHERLAVAEALAQTSMMTSPAARRRLAARQVEMDLIAGGDDMNYDHMDYVPPKQLLMYMVR